jgi:hypothetical protein
MEAGYTGRAAAAAGGQGPGNEFRNGIFKIFGYNGG